MTWRHQWSLISFFSYCSWLYILLISQRKFLLIEMDLPRTDIDMVPGCRDLLSYLWGSPGRCRDTPDWRRRSWGRTRQPTANLPGSPWPCRTRGSRGNRPEELQAHFELTPSFIIHSIVYFLRVLMFYHRAWWYSQSDCGSRRWWNNPAQSAAGTPRRRWTHIWIQREGTLDVIHYTAASVSLIKNSSLDTGCSCPCLVCMSTK